MNSLSWLLYFSDVVSTLKSTVAIAGVMTILIMGFVTIVSFIEELQKLQKWSIRSVIVGVVLVFSAPFIPSQRTIMMIAASEFGEEIATSAEAKNLGGKAYQSLDKFLSDYLEKEQ